MRSGTVITSAGNYIDTLRSISGCDSLLTFAKVSVATLKKDSITALICVGSAYKLPSGKTVNVTGIYTDTLKYSGGCDSLILTVNLNVYNPEKTTVAASFCSGKSYTLPSGKTVSAAGKYLDTLRSKLNECDSAIITTNLSFIAAKTQNITAFVCTGDNYILPSGKSVRLKGIYIDTLRTSSGCDSLISTITLSIDTVAKASHIVSICEGQKYTMPSGLIIDKQGTYTDTLKNIRGCDSLITSVKLNLAVLKKDSFLVLICSGKSYKLPSGKLVNTAGIFIDTLRYAGGCDSVLYFISVNLYHAGKSTVNASICSGMAYTLPSGKSVSVAGKYVDTLRSKLTGCDSAIITTNLSLIPALVKSFNATVCGGSAYLLPSGKFVTAAGIYVDTLRTALGCDSVINTITLSIDEKTLVSKEATICAGSQYITPSGIVLEKAGIFKDTLRNIRGCDSLIMTIKISITAVAQKQLAATICAGNSYQLPSGKLVSNQNLYMDTLRYKAGCDSVVYSIALTVFEPRKESREEAICTGNSYLMPSGKMVNSAGKHLDTLKNKLGCDSILYNITIRLVPVVKKAIAVSICAGNSYLLPSGKSVKLAGNYADTLRGAGGCDSIITNIALTVDEVTKKTFSVSVCNGESYRLPSGMLVSKAGTYTDTIKNIRNCDSLISTITLLLKPTSNSNKAVLLCIGQPYLLPSGRSVILPGTYRDTVINSAGCDSIITTTITQRLPLSVTIIGSTDICTGSFTTLKANASGGLGAGYQYSWSVAGATGNELIIAPTGLTRIVVTVTDGCSIAAAKDTVDINPIPTPEPAFTVPAFTGCAPYRVLFSNNSKAVSGSKAHWNFGTGIAADTSISYNPTFSFTKPGVYKVRLTITTASGCAASTESTINVIAKPTVSISGPDAICIGSPAQFNANAAGDVKNWKWDFGNGRTSQTQKPDPQLYTAAGAYKIMLTGIADQACPDTAYFTVTVNPAPVVSLNYRETKICLGQSIQLAAAGGSKYSWSPSTGLSAVSIANPVAAPTQDMLYRVTVSSVAGCSSVDSVRVNVTQPFVMTVSDDAKICAGEEVKLLASGAVKYIWTPATSLNNATIADPVAKPYITTAYTVTGFGKDECFITEKQVTITVIPLPVVQPGRDTSVYGGSSFPIHLNVSSDVTQYSWSPSTYLSCTNCAAPVASPRENIIYKVTVANAEGCRASDELSITLACSDAQVFIPNTFTPNHDGANDVFYPRGKGIKTVKRIRIFNRWGELVFEKKDFNIDDKGAGWDGVYKGEKLGSGVFVYAMQMVCDNGQLIDKSGSIMLVR